MNLRTLELRTNYAAHRDRLRASRDPVRRLQGELLRRVLRGLDLDEESAVAAARALIACRPRADLDLEAADLQVPGRPFAEQCRREWAEILAPCVPDATVETARTLVDRALEELNKS
jgi:hypothetical protein